MKNKMKNLWIVLILCNVLGCENKGDIKEVCDKDHVEMIPYFDSSTETIQYIYNIVCDESHKEICMEDYKNSCIRWQKLDYVK